MKWNESNVFRTGMKPTFTVAWAYNPRIGLARNPPPSHCWMFTTRGTILSKHVGATVGRHDGGKGTLLSCPVNIGVVQASGEIGGARDGGKATGTSPTHGSIPGGSEEEEGRLDFTHQDHHRRVALSRSPAMTPMLLPKDLADDIRGEQNMQVLT